MRTSTKGRKSLQEALCLLSHSCNCSDALVRGRAIAQAQSTALRTLNGHPGVRFGGVSATGGIDKCQW